MMIQTPQLIAGAMLSLSTLACPPEPTLPEPAEAPAYLNTPCEPAFRAVLMYQYDPLTLPCNPDGRQILVTTIDDTPNGEAELECNNSGGQLLYIPHTDTFLCIDIDY